MPNEEEILMSVIEYYRERKQEYPGEFRLMVVWNSPQEHPEMELQLQGLAREWPGFSAHRNMMSTSKCDNLNMAMQYLETDMALLNDADTMVSAATMCRASINLFEGDLDVAQSTNIHCWDDCIGWPESSCFVFGALTTMMDGTKPLNMSVQGLYKHSPFNGRGGFWRTPSLKLVGFDHRSIGEDHDATYRGFAYYGLKGVLDPNMLCMEREPPNCKALTNQRTRWETAALEMRRTFPWVLRSEHYTRFEMFTLLWSQLSSNVNLPLQQLPLQVCQIIPLAVTKAFISMHVFGDEPASLRNMCRNEDCIAKFVINGTEVAFPLAFVVFVSLFAFWLLLRIIDIVIRTLLVRYRPRAAWCLFTTFLVPFTYLPFTMYVQYWALYDFCWGSAKFICTARSSGTTNSMRSITDEPLCKPLLQSAHSAHSTSVSTMALSSNSSSCNSLVSLV